MSDDTRQPEHAPYYPVYVSLKHKLCLIVGGGTVAERKIRGLLECGSSVRLVARELTPWLHTLASTGKLRHAGKDYEEHHLDGVDLVFAATSDAILNRRIAAHAQERRIWCNMATDPELGSFIVPAMFQQGPLSIAISTSGLSPALSKLIRENLEAQFGPEWAVFLNLMGLFRATIQSRKLGTIENQRLFKEVAKLPIPAWIKEHQRDRIVEEILRICHSLVTRKELLQLLDQAWKPFFS